MKQSFKKYRTIISLLVTIVIFAAMAYYLKKERESFSLLTQISGTNILVLCAASLAFRLALGFNFKILMLFFHVKLILREWFGLTAIATMANYLLPVKGGVLTQALYLKKVHGFNYSHFFSSAAGFYIITFMVNAAIGMFFSFSRLPLDAIFTNKAFLFFLAVSIALIICCIAIYSLSKLKTKPHFLSEIIAGFGMFIRKKMLLPGFISSQILVIAAVGLRLFFAFRALNISVGVSECLIISLVAAFSVVISITPANLGIKEFFIAFSSSAVGIPAAQGLLVAILDRIIDVIISFGAGSLFTYILSKQKPLAFSRT